MRLIRFSKGKSVEIHSRTLDTNSRGVEVLKSNATSAVTGLLAWSSQMLFKTAINVWSDLVRAWRAGFSVMWSLCHWITITPVDRIQIGTSCRMKTEIWNQPRGGEGGGERHAGSELLLSIVLRPVSSAKRAAFSRGTLPKSKASITTEREWGQQADGVTIPPLRPLKHIKTRLQATLDPGDPSNFINPWQPRGSMAQFGHGIVLRLAGVGFHPTNQSPSWDEENQRRLLH